VSVVVVGSANLDLVYTVQAFPRPGETVLATGAAQHPGGKGSNQAVAAARAGADVAMVARLGEDTAGDLLAATLRDAGVDTRAVTRTLTRSGTALITVDAAGENTIVVDAGANATLTDLGGAEGELVAEAGVLLAQLEIPLETVQAAAELTRAGGGTVVLNAAPVRELPAELLQSVDVLVVNEHEAAVLADPPAPDPEGAADVLLRTVGAVVVTLGGRGALVAERGKGLAHVPAPRVVPVDTTAAGDTFCGALAAALDRGETLDAATRFAVTAASLSVLREGAVPSIPTRAEIERALADT
jgi:ribokinase